MAQKSDEIITDTLIYYYEAGKRLDSETGERLYEQYMSKPDDTENFILKVPVYISRPNIKGNTNKTTAVNETIFLLPGGRFASLDKNNYSNADQCTAGLLTLLSTSYTTVLIDYQHVSENNLNLLVLRGCLPGLVANNLKYKQLKASLICF